MVIHYIVVEVSLYDLPLLQTTCDRMISVQEDVGGLILKFCCAVWKSSEKRWRDVRGTMETPGSFKVMVNNCRCTDVIATVVYFRNSVTNKNLFLSLFFPSSFVIFSFSLDYYSRHFSFQARRLSGRLKARYSADFSIEGANEIIVTTNALIMLM